MEEEKSKDVGKVKSVMVAIDESEESYYALEWTLKNFGDSIANSEVVVFTVQPLSLICCVTGFGDSKELKNDLGEHHKKTASSLLERAKDICRKFKITPKTVSAIGDPKDAKYDAVNNYNIDLLVVGSHGHGAPNRDFSGSVCVCNYSVHNVKCPVLVVRQKA